jgi:hypothetical protein
MPGCAQWHCMHLARPRCPDSAVSTVESNCRSARKGLPSGSSTPQAASHAEAHAEPCICHHTQRLNVPHSAAGPFGTVCQAYPHQRAVLHGSLLVCAVTARWVCACPGASHDHAPDVYGWPDVDAVAAGQVPVGAGLSGFAASTQPAARGTGSCTPGASGCQLQHRLSLHCWPAALNVSAGMRWGSASGRQGSQ